MSNIAFFNDICTQQILKDALLINGFLDPEVYHSGNGVRNDGLKLEKRGWSLPATGDRVERVCVHYESVRRGHFCIHVEISPYEKGKSIKPNDPRLITLAFELKSKATLMQTIRERIIEDKNIFSKVYPSTKQLDPTDRPNTNAAVKFDKLTSESTAEECAEFFASVITLTSSIVDELVAQHLIDRANQ